jgi:hypothetical protein
MADYRDLQQHHSAVVADLTLTSTSDSDPDNTDVVAVRSANHQIYVQKITLSITTHGNSVVFTVQDDATTPVVIAAHTDATAAAGVPSVVHWDFGTVGTPLTLGKNLDVTLNGGTIQGRVHIEGYQKLGAVVAAASTN